MAEEVFSDGRILVKTGDITGERTDAIVNAANRTLFGGGGVDGAIHRRGGPRIIDECKKIRAAEYPEGLPTGRAVITTAGDLAARFVIHTVGPVYGQEDGREKKLLAACYRNSLQIAAEYGLRSVAFPSISTGAFYFPKDVAARIASLAIRDFLRRDTSLAKIHLVFFSDADQRVFIQHQCF